MHHPPKSNGDSSHPRILTKPQYLPLRREQTTMAVIYLCCLVGIVFYVCHKSMTQNGLIDIDEAEPIEFSYLIDINDAPWPAIANLPGIGQTLAQEIVRYRQDNGPFERLEQITEIRGIGPAKLEQIREFIQPIESTPTGSK